MITRCEGNVVHELAGKPALERLRTEMGKILVGQEDVIRSVLTAFFAEGHALLEGAPGLGKTAIVRTLAAAA